MVGDVRVDGSLVCSNCETVRYKILREVIFGLVWVGEQMSFL